MDADDRPWSPALRRALARRQGRHAPTESPTLSGAPLAPVYGPTTSVPRAPGIRADRLAGGVSVHPRHPLDRLPRQALDDSAVRRLRVGSRHQRTLPPAAGRRRRRPQRRLRHAHADGPRLRCPEAAGRSATAASPSTRRMTWSDSSRHPARPGDDVDDDQRTGCAVLLLLRRRCRASWCRRAELGGTLQTDILKEYIAQKEWLFPPEPHLRLIGDLLEWTQEHARVTTRSASAAITSERPDRQLRKSWRSPLRTVSPTSSSGFRGLGVDAFVPRLTFFFDAHIDFFEEIAKFRAARRIWARWMRDRFGATTERAQWLKFHTQTAGVSLTAQQPYNNVARTAIEALAAVLGGTNSLHTNALDEVLALPTERRPRSRFERSMC